MRLSILYARQLDCQKKKVQVAENMGEDQIFETPKLQVLQMLTGTE